MSRHFASTIKTVGGQMFANILREPVEKKREKNRTGVFTRRQQGEHLGHESGWSLIAQRRMVDDAPGLCPDGRNKGIDEAFLQALVGIDVVALQVLNKVEEMYDDIVRHAGEGVVVFALTVGDVIEAKLRFCCAKPS